MVPEMNYHILHTLEALGFTPEKAKILERVVDAEMRDCAPGDRFMFVMNGKGVFRTSTCEPDLCGETPCLVFEIEKEP